MTDKKKQAIRCAAQFAGIALLILIDYLIKEAAYAKLKNRETVTLIPGVLGLSYTENTGAAFNLFASSTTALSIVTGVVLLGGLIALFLIKKKPLIYDICVPLIIAGGAGNQLDRMTRGYVIDYIRTLFVEFPIFNFADCLITCACFVVMGYLIYDIFRDFKNDKKKASPETTEEAP